MLRIIPRPSPQQTTIPTEETASLFAQGRTSAASSVQETALISEASTLRGEGRASGLKRSRCSICRHNHANAIALEVLSGASVRSVAERYEVSKSALDRHIGHLPKNLVQARFETEIAAHDVLLAEIVQHQADLKSMFYEARLAKNRGAATQISTALLRSFELVRKIVDDQSGRNSPPNGAGSEETAALLGKIFQALQKHPDARITLAEALSPTAELGDKPKVEPIS